jgi:glycine cleavage system H protein
MIMSDDAPLSIPTDLYYDPSHVWARLDPVGRITVGIDALGLQSLGDMAYVSLHPAGSAVRRGEPLGVLEAAKMTGDLIAPVSGTVVARNEAVLQDPSLVNQDPYGLGWLVSIEPSDWEKESVTLIHGGAVMDWVSAEMERYRAQGWIR